MCPSSVPSSSTSSDMGGNGIEYLVFLAICMSGALLSLRFRYAGVKLMGAYLRGSISGRSPLCCRDCLMEEMLGNLTIFGGVVITVGRPPVLNCCITSSSGSCSDIHLLRIVSSNTSENYRIRESNRSMGTPMVFIGFCLIPLPTIIFPTIVTFNVNPPSSLTSMIHHQCTNKTVSYDHYSHFSTN